MDKVTPIGSPAKKRRGRVPARRSTKTTGRAAVEKEHWEKATQAYELLLGGKSHSEVAEILGIAHVDDVWRLMTERFQYDASRLTDAQRKDILGMELLRLNALQAAVWPSAMMGDPKSVDSAVRIIATRAKIAGLEQVDPVVNKNLVLVMGDKEEEYIAALKAVSTDD
jgi:hypothetical protein